MQGIKIYPSFALAEFLQGTAMRRVLRDALFLKGAVYIYMYILALSSAISRSTDLQKWMHEKNCKISIPLLGQ